MQVYISHEFCDSVSFRLAEQTDDQVIMLNMNHKQLIVTRRQTHARHLQNKTRQTVRVTWRTTLRGPVAQSELKRFSIECRKTDPTLIINYTTQAISNRGKTKTKTKAIAWLLFDTELKTILIRNKSNLKSHHFFNDCFFDHLQPYDKLGNIKNGTLRCNTIQKINFKSWKADAGIGHAPHAPSRTPYKGRLRDEFTR